MQNKLIIVLILSISVLLFQSCTDILSILTGSKPGEIKDDLETPEPGTKLTPRSNLVLKTVDRYATNPDSVFDTKSRILKLVRPYIRYTQDFKISSENNQIPVRLYCNFPEKKRDSLPVILYFHGGGFIWGDIEKFDSYCRKLTRETGSIIVSADYRLAPENPFPAAIHDSYRVLEWAYENIREYGGDPGKIYVMGESAGANLAAVTTLMSLDSCGPPVYGQIICCPVTSFEEKVFPSRKYFMLQGRSYMISEDYMYRCKKAYLPDSIDFSHPYISPLRAQIDSNLPPAMIITAQVDPLRDEGKAYAEKLQQAGVDVIYLEYEGMVHAFMNFYPFLREGREAIEEVNAFVHKIQ